MRVIITTKKVQNRKHRKKRINKKWAKRYGYSTYEVQEPGKFFVSCSRGGIQYLYIREDDFEKLKKTIREVYVENGYFDRILLGGLNKFKSRKKE